MFKSLLTLALTAALVTAVPAGVPGAHANSSHHMALPRIAQQVAVHVERTSSFEELPAGKKFCITLGSYSNTIVGENLFGADLWKLTVKTTACKTADLSLIRSRTYRRSFSTTNLGAPWSLEKWTGKTNRLSGCERISGQRWCKFFTAYASAHVKLGVGDASLNKYPWAETKYGPESLWHDNGI